MSYMHIENLYAANDIMMFKECFAMEKIHGTSANVQWRDGHSWFSSGSSLKVKFRELFPSDEEMAARFNALGHPIVTVFGEAYGGKIMKMSHVYGKELRFIAFEVKIGEYWLAVP